MTTVEVVTRWRAAHVPSTRPRRAVWEPGLFAVAVGLSLLPVLLLGHMVSVDGPSHVLGGYVLGHTRTPVIAHYYRLDRFPTPNLGTELVLAGLLRLFSPAVGEKVLVAGYVVLFPYAVRYAVRSVSRSATWLSYAAFPLVFQHLLFFGFDNFCYGVALATLAVGCVARHRLAWTPRAGVALAVLLLLTYFTHLLPLLMALLFLLVVGVADAFTRRSDGTRPGAREVVRRTVVPAAAAVPVLALMAAYALRPNPYGVDMTRVPLLDKLTRFVSLDVIELTFTPRERIGAIALAVVLAALVVIRWRTRPVGAAARARPSSWPVALTVLVALAIYFATPHRIDAAYGYLDERVSVFPVLFTLLWLAARPPRAAVRRIATGAFVAIAAFLAVVRMPALVHYNAEIDEVTSVESVLRPHSTLTTVRLWLDAPRGTPWQGSTDPLRHVGSLVAADIGGVDLVHYEAQWAYFPTQFRAPYLYAHRTGHGFPTAETVPPRTTLVGSARHATSDLTYVLVIGARRARPGVFHRSAVRRMYRMLDEHYRLLTTSAPTGLVDVYVRTDGGRGREAPGSVSETG